MIFQYFLSNFDFWLMIFQRGCDSKKDILSKLSPRRSAHVSAKAFALQPTSSNATVGRATLRAPMGCGKNTDRWSGGGFVVLGSFFCCLITHFFMVFCLGLSCCNWETATFHGELAIMTLFAWLKPSWKPQDIFVFQDLHLKICIVTRVISMAQASRFSLRRLASMRAFSWKPVLCWLSIHLNSMFAVMQLLSHEFLALNYAIWQMLNQKSILYIYIYTWNPNDLYFWRSTPQNKALSNQNKGHLGSRYIYYTSWHFVTFQKFKQQGPWCHFLFTRSRWGVFVFCRRFLGKIHLMEA